MLNRTGMAGEKVMVNDRKTRPRRRIPRTILGLVITGIALLALVAVLLAPSGETAAIPGRTGGNCNGSGSCHPLTTTSFLSVDGFPAQYMPGAEYTITVTLADTNGWTSENSFDMILSAGGGSMVGINPYVKNITGSLQVATNQAFNTTVAQWTVKWTAPASGDVTINTWAVLGTGGVAADSPYEHTTTTVTQSAIPEFSFALLPIAGVAVALLLVARVSKRRGRT